MLLLLNDLSYDDLKTLSLINNNKPLHDINTICDYVLDNNPIITSNIKLIKKENNYIILENTNSLFDLSVGYISDIPITRIDILHKIYHDDNYEIIESCEPKIKNMNIFSSSKLEHLYFSDHYDNIEKYTKNVYTLRYPYKKNPYFYTLYKLYFDRNIENIEMENIDKISAVGVFIYNQQLRIFIVRGFDKFIDYKI